MLKKLIPTHKYKTSVLFYDDNPEYLAFLKNNLPSNAYNFIFVSDLNDFNVYIQASNQINDELPSLFIKLDNEISDNPQHDAFDFDISQISKIRNIHNKESEISTIFIDNNLTNSEYNGLRLCQNIGESSFNKVLLTGECDRFDAIRALNTKAINLYIEKYDLANQVNADYNIIAKILSELDRLTDTFFIANNPYYNELTSDNNFKQLFDEVIANQKIVEYYLFDKETFWLIDATGKESYLRCWPENKFAEYFELHSDDVNSAKLKELDSVKNKQAIPTEKGLKPAINFKNLYYCLY